MRRIIQLLLWLGLSISFTTAALWGLSLIDRAPRSNWDLSFGDWKISSAMYALVFKRSVGSWWWIDSSAYYHEFRLAGFRCYSAGADTGSVLLINLPFWFIVAAPLLPSFLWFLPERKRRRLQSVRGKICTRCGYDLRESRERCPECGTPVPTVGVSA